MGDDRSWNDGDKLSFSERDRRRRDGQPSREKRSPGVSKAKEEAVTKQYIKQLDGLFSSAKGGAEAEKLRAAIRLADACRQYREVAGFPEDAALLGAFLDSGDAELVVGALEALQTACDAGSIKASGGMRSQIRMLAEDPDDEVAELAEVLAERL